MFAFLVVMPIKKQYVINRASRSSRARGLKLKTLFASMPCPVVALFTGAWIETLIQSKT